MGERPDRRSAPAPLIHHLTSTAALYETGARIASLANQPQFPWATQPTDAEQTIADAVATAPPLDMGLALRAEAGQRLGNLLKGVRLYQSHPARRQASNPRVIWQAGSSRLLDFGTAGGTPVFVIPSLINTYHILDLDHGASLFDAMVAAGLRPMVLDWGTSGVEEQSYSLASYAANRLVPAFMTALQVSGAEAMPVLGYCMGGTLAVALAAHMKQQVSRLSLMATPWNFGAMTAMRGGLAAMGIPGRKADIARAIAALSATFGFVPVVMVQHLFAQLEPGLAARKFRRFARMEQTSDEARRFVLTEDWLNNGPHLSGPTALNALSDWQAENQTMLGQWHLFDEAVNPDRLSQPTLVFAARADRIVPEAAAAPLAHIIPDAQLITPETGHIGLIVSETARKAVWPPLFSFLSA